jgi:hypothetical protein
VSDLLHEPTVAETHPGEPVTILCVASYFKGNPFLEQCKKEGAKVLLLTHEALLGKPWAREFCDEVFAVKNLYDRAAVVNAVSYLARSHDITRIAPLDDYDVEMVAHLREHLRIPGMGETTARYFRDKLAMRARARDRGIKVPEFVHVLNDARLTRFMKEVPAPWLLKPRSEASSVGIRRLQTEADVWPVVEELGDHRSSYLIERMIPGDVFHVDAITEDRNVLLSEVHQYRRPLLQIAQGGGIFATRTVERGSVLEKQLLDTHSKVIEHLGIVRGVTHTEFIRGADDGEVYFLETAARVGGVHISDLVEASTGVSLWREWARLEVYQGERPYTLPPRHAEYGGLIVSLAKQEAPDTSAYDDPEVVWRMQDNANHVGLIVRSPDRERVEQLLESYEPRIAQDFLATLPQTRTPTA